ncbi:MAG TPA: POTRA domain-containing protein [Spirochaetota bacterium]|nr:POTRA domain-containing protein [Spirochaetota bacterium]HPN82636.1 POTRA domain-containing protein [Spirochaetota bacterium]
MGKRTGVARWGLVLVVCLCGVLQAQVILSNGQPAPAVMTGSWVTVRNIHFRGNESIPAPVLLQMMDLRTNTAHDYGMVRAAVERVTTFYARQGYTLTRVLSSHVRLDGVLEIIFDEGRINRIRILNRNIYAIYGFKKELQLSEGEIFNLIIVEQELERIRRKFNLKDLKYTLRANQAIPGSFDLYIMADSFKGRSFGFVLDNDEFSLVPRISFKDYDFWGLDHEISISAETRVSWLDISRRKASMEYFFPSFLGENFRPFVRLEKTHEKKSRNDIDVTYWEDNFIISLFMENRFENYFRIRAGIMHNSYRLFDLETGATPAEIVNGRYEMLGYYQAQVMLEYRHPEDRYRRDKHFLATLKLDYVIHEHDENFYILQMDIRKTFQRKLDDVMFRFSEMHIFSGESFYRDYDITDFLLRGYDGGKLFTRHAWMLSSEYRMAVYRDIIKFIFFVDTALYLPLQYDHGVHNLKPRIRTSVGQGVEFNFHEWSLKLYYGVPSYKEVFEGKLHLSIQKVF